MDKLWVDKYRPKQLDSLDYHNNLVNNFKARLYNLKN